jgi:hypothetical protein
MTPKRTFPPHGKRNSERYRLRALDDFGDEVLDDWMVAYPGADPARLVPAG